MIRHVEYLTCELLSSVVKCQKSKMFKFHQILDKYIRQIVWQIGELTQFISGTCNKLQGVCGKATLALNYE